VGRWERVSEIREVEGRKEGRKMRRGRGRRRRKARKWSIIVRYRGEA
jgi:hypothetical protein